MISDLEKVTRERDDAMFALQALCEEVNAMKTGHEYKLEDCIRGAVEYREYIPGKIPETGISHKETP